MAARIADLLSAALFIPAALVANTVGYFLPENETIRFIHQCAVGSLTITGIFYDLFFTITKTINPKADITPGGSRPQGLFEFLQ